MHAAKDVYFAQKLSWMIWGLSFKLVSILQWCFHELVNQQRFDCFHTWCYPVIFTLPGNSHTLLGFITASLSDHPVCPRESQNGREVVPPGGQQVEVDVRLTNDENQPPATTAGCHFQDINQSAWGKSGSSLPGDMVITRNKPMIGNPYWESAKEQLPATCKASNHQTVQVI